MIGRGINKKIRKELEDRRNALGRNKGEALSSDKPSYSLEDLAVRTSYVRLVSPVYGTEIKGRLLQQEEFNYSEGEEGQSPVAETARFTDNFEREHWRSQNRGATPPAGITSVTTAYIGEGASINTAKEATIELKCFSLLQYEQLVEEFVMIGRILYLEFGWSSPKIDSKRITADTRNFLTTTLNNGKPEIILDISAVQKYPQELILNTSGNTDLFVGLVKNYEAKANENGGFDFTITMVSQGVAMYDSSFGTNNSEMVTLNSGNKAATDAEKEEDVDKNSFEKPSADVRDEMVLMAKLRAIIQEDFDIKDVFQFGMHAKSMTQEEKEAINMGENTTQYAIYSDIRDAKTIFIQLRKSLINKDFEVIRDASAEPEYLIARHKSNDLIISMVRVEEPQEQKEIEAKLITTAGAAGGALDFGKGTTMYINYFVSMRYLEDNVFSRIFGTVDDTGVLQGGIRSCYFRETTEQVEDSETSEMIDNVSVSLENNKMMMHQVVVPKNLNDVLINTEATRNVLLNSAAGVYPTSFEKIYYIGQQEGTFKKLGNYTGVSAKRVKYTFTQDSYKRYTESLQKILANALPFFNNNEDASRDSEEPATTIPNTSPADFRHMYVNVDIVQRSFLGKSNEPFYERNTFISNKSTVQRLENPAHTHVRRSAIFNLDPLNPLFNPKGVALTLKEGVNNLLNIISENLYDLPIFELGVNIHLPSFLAVTDMRYKKEDVAYTFDSFSRTSIVKSVDLTSQVPNSVQLAAYFGTSQPRMDRVLGNQSTHVPLDLLQNINDRYKKAKQKEYNQAKYRGLNFGKSEYLKKAEGDDEFEKHASGVIPKIISFSRDVASVFSRGIQTKLINSQVIKSKSTAGIHEKPKDLSIRDNIPGINDALVKNANDINKLITSISGEQDPKFTLLLKEGAVTAGEFGVKNSEGVLSQERFNFNLTQGDISEDYRKPTLVISTHPDFQFYIDTILYASDRQSFNKLQGKISFFTLTIVIDGIAGVFPGDAFLISHLPSYIKNKYYFIATNVEQSLTSEGWSTTITAMQVPRRKTILDALPIEEDIALAYIPVEGTTPTDPDASDVYDPSLFPGERGGNPDPLTGPLPAEMNSTNQRLLRGTDEDQDPADAQADLTATQQSQIPRDTRGPKPGREVDEPGPPAPPDADYDPNLAAENLNDERGRINEEGWGGTQANLRIGQTFELQRPETPRLLPDVKPFIPYEISQNGTAEILISQTGDGQIAIQGLEDGPKQEVKVYPGGDNSDPGQAITFSLGAADILSANDFSNIIETYVDLGGDETAIRNKLQEMYGYYEIEDSDEVINSEDAGRVFGSWDKKRKGTEKVVVYVLKTQTANFEKLARQTSGNPDLQDPENNTASGNTYFDDIIHAILSQPERTNIIGQEIVLPGKTNEVEKEEVKDEEPLIEQGEEDTENQESDTSEDSGTDGTENNKEVVVEPLPEQTKKEEPKVAVGTKKVLNGVTMPVSGQLVHMQSGQSYSRVRDCALRGDDNKKTPLFGIAENILGYNPGISGIAQNPFGGRNGNIRLLNYVSKDNFNDLWEATYPNEKKLDSKRKYQKMFIAIFEMKFVPNEDQEVVGTGFIMNAVGLGTGAKFDDSMSSSQKRKEAKVAARNALRAAGAYFLEKFGTEYPIDAQGNIIQ